MTGLQLDTIHVGDALTVLRTLPDGCVNCIVSSPPYFGLRDYGTAEWEGGDPNCDHVIKSARNDVTPERLAERAAQYGTGQGEGSHVSKVQARDVCPKCGAKRIDSQIGLEPTPSEYVAALVGIFREAWRVLRDDGVLWLNLGDSYAGSKKGMGADGTAYGGSKQRTNAGSIGVPVSESGLPAKNLIGIPWRVAFGLQDDGWTLRSDVIWAKPNPMPESVTDRPTKAHEYVFLFSKQPKYWYDAAAVAEDAVGGAGGDFMAAHETVQPEHGGVSRTGRWARNGEGRAAVSTRNRRSVWTITPGNFKGAHFATMPEELAEICIKAGCPEWRCEQCGAPWVAQVERESNWDARKAKGATGGTLTNGHNTTHGARMSHDLGTGAVTHHGYAPTCACNAGKRAGVVLDPFAGAGTTALVAKRLNRRYIGIELNPDYAEMARARIDSIPYTLFSLMEVVE